MGSGVLDLYLVNWTTRTVRVSAGHASYCPWKTVVTVTPMLQITGLRGTSSEGVSGSQNALTGLASEDCTCKTSLTSTLLPAHGCKNTDRILKKWDGEAGGWVQCHLRRYKVDQCGNTWKIQDSNEYFFFSVSFHATGQFCNRTVA